MRLIELMSLNVPGIADHLTIQSQIDNTKKPTVKPVEDPLTALKIQKPSKSKS